MSPKLTGQPGFGIADLARDVMGQPRDGGGPFPAADAAKVARISDELREALAADPPPSVTGKPNDRAEKVPCYSLLARSTNLIVLATRMPAVGPAGFTYGKL